MNPYSLPSFAGTYQGRRMNILVIIPSDPFHASCVIPRWCQALLSDDVLDFLIVKDPRSTRTGPGICASRELAEVGWSLGQSKIVTITEPTSEIP